MGMVFESSIKSSDKAAFIEKVSEISDRLGINPQWLMGVMWKESKISSSIQNPISNATGLIQFMPKTADRLGISVDELKVMDPIRQLDFVEKYYKPYKGKIKSFVDMYLATFMPIALGKPDEWVMEYKGASAELIAKQNGVVDLNKDKKITVGEFKQYCFIGIPEAEAKILRGEVEDEINNTFSKKKRRREIINLILASVGGFALLLALIFIINKVQKVKHNS